MFAFTKAIGYAILTLFFASNVFAAQVTIWSRVSCTGSKDGADCETTTWSQDDSVGDCDWRATSVDEDLSPGAYNINTHGRQCLITLFQQPGFFAGNVDCSGAGGSNQSPCVAVTPKDHTNNCGLASACQSYAICEGDF